MRPLAVYVHIPFCVIKCGYCDFNAYAGMDRLKRSYHEAVIREIDSWSGVLAGSAVTSISFGGGTPGESDPRDLVRIAGHVRNLAAALGQRVEVSLEANPGTVLGVVVDGSAGPRYRMKPGSLLVARRSGLPIVLLRVWFRRCLRFRTWDRTALPLP